MSYQVRTRTAAGVEGRDATVYELLGPHGDTAEVWPALGLNVFRWAPSVGDRCAEVLYADPALFSGGRPTRSGVPVLFPFPNRIRDGRFVWEGRTYQLELNDPAQKNAAHGWACRSAWRVTGAGATPEGAFVRGTFRGSLDGGVTPTMWPADHEIELTVRLSRGTLRLEAVVRNPDTVPLPFGLGYHPYFLAGPDTTVEVPARSYWPLTDNLPDGTVEAVNASRDLNRPRRYGDLNVDDVLTALPPRAARADGLIERAAIGGAANVRVFCSPAFREMVVFTPPHRQAFCAEPYTCTTDAINLSARGVNAGWLVLPPGGTWSAVVELWV